MLFSVDVWTRSTWTVITVSGELDLATAPRLRQAVVAAAGSGPVDLVLDLSGVDFIDSIGLGVVVSAQKRVRTRGGRLAVAGLVPQVRTLFALTRLDEIVEVFGSLDDALQGGTPERDDGADG